MAQALDNDKACLRDPWLAELYVSFKTLTSVVFRLLLLLWAFLLRTDNGHVETGNANLRREAKGRTQCQRINQKDLSTKWIGQQSRSPALGGERSPSSHAGGVADDDGEATKAGPSGGPWRAHMRRSGTFDSKAASLTYRALSMEEKQELIGEGAEATQAAREGNVDGTAFGPKRRDMLRRNEMRVLQSRLERLESQEEPTHAIQKTLELAATAGRDPDQVATEVRRLSKILSKAQKAREAADVQELEKYVEQHAEAAQRLLPAGRGEGGLGPAAFQATPGQLG